MDDLQQVRELRQAAPRPDRQRLAPGRQLLVAAAGKTSVRQRRLRTDWRLAAVGVAAAVTAGVVATALVVGGDSHTSDPAAAQPIVTPLGSAKDTLDRLADVLAASPAPRPHDGQWVYSRKVDINKTFKNGKPQTNESWRKYADPRFEHGREGDDHSPKETFQFLSTLPDDTAGVLEKVRAYYPGNGDEDQDQLDFQSACVLAGDYPAQPEDMAKVYRALATVPGVKVKMVEDAAGRQAVDVYRRADKGSQDMELLIDPRTGRYDGTRYRMTEPNGHLPQVHPGDIVMSTAVLDQALVEKKGRRS